MSGLLALFAIAASIRGQLATIREEPQVVTTYPFRGPNPSPTRPGGQGVQQRIYPYFAFDELTAKGTDQTWNVVRMENPYIQAFILPAVGGKLAGAIEKSTQNAFIYYNHVLKFRNISMRGPWTSGGIEANFGIIGHAPSTATPVDYLVRRNPDGSVSCIVGAMDLPSRTEWRVEYRIAPDQAYIEARSLWYNTQPLDQSYYVWMNVAEKAADDLELVLPGSAWIGHNYNVPSQPWPTGAGGRNLAWYKNHAGVGDGSFFVQGRLNDFSGGYWHGSGFGYGHFALHEEVPGQKFFHWSLSRDGAIWENLLTDRDGQYIEHQTGRLLDQSDTGFLAPYSVDRWEELYFPYKKIGPMVKATPYGALNVRRDSNDLVLSFCALQKIDEAITVRAAGKQVFAGRIALRPMEVYEQRVPASIPAGQLRVDIGDKLSYTDDPNDGLLARPLTFHNYDTSSLEGLYQSAERDDRERKYESALRKYQTCLERDPSNLRALARIAGIYCRRAEYRKGLEYARKALYYSMYDPAANYIYGIISERLENLADAKETLGWAARSMEFRSAAYSELGSIYAIEGNLERSAEYLRRSLEYDAHNLRALEVLATVQRLSNQSAQARATIARILEIDPLNHLAGFEQYLLDLTPASLQSFRSLIRDELPHETYLEIAAYYRSLRREDDALRVLDAAPEQATVRYWQAYLQRDKLPAQSRRTLGQASAMSPYLVFPFRAESIPVFEWAATQSNDWKPSYYLGLIYWGMQRTADARKQFDAVGNHPDYAPAYITRAFLEKDSDAPRARADYERAHALDPKDWRTAYYLANFYTEQVDHAKALDVAADAARQFPDQDAIKVLTARAYLNNGRYENCNAVLAGAAILPFEGQSDTHNLFVECLISQAMTEMKAAHYDQAIAHLNQSRDYPERLGTGAPADPDYRVQDYLLMFCYRETGRQAQAAETQAGIASFIVRRGATIAENQNQQVEVWYRGAFRTRPEHTALQELSLIVRGGTGRRRQ
jgi:tetratricopeptide (TPR) repeat protein